MAAGQWHVTVIVQILAGMKLWLLIVGTVLVYITVENEAKRYVT